MHHRGENQKVTGKLGKYKNNRTNNRTNKFYN